MTRVQVYKLMVFFAVGNVHTLTHTALRCANNGKEIESGSENTISTRCIFQSIGEFKLILIRKISIMRNRSKMLAFQISIIVE